MGLKMRRQVAIPAGQHFGKIVNAEETSKTFDQKKGPEPVIEITIRPAYRVKGAETLDCSVIFTPVLNGISALSHLLERLEIDVPEGEYFDPKALVGMEVAFESGIFNDFVRIEKRSIQKRDGGKNQKLPVE